ncbi:MAG TPA: DUF3943 domain-containing protein [Candidatus Tectomicrobia bacterium]
MRSTPANWLQWVLFTSVLALVLVLPSAGAAEEAAPAPVLSWEEAVVRKSFFIPALEIAGFIFGLNQVDRHVVKTQEFDTNAHTFWKNLTSAAVIDHDPFSVNQLGHPYQGSIYYGFARSAGLPYWQSLLYTLGGSFLWETYGEATPPSLNDHIASGIGGTFLGEALFRMASLLLEGSDPPRFWRELGATVLSPPTGFNRLAFGDRFAAVFPSRNPALFIRLRLGATLTTQVTNAALANDVIRQEGRIDFAMTYGLPGQPGYRYTRPFDYFHLEFTAVPNARSVPNAIENVQLRGLLVGATYEVGATVRGVWGLLGNYDYLSPQIFRISTTALSLGTMAQWWLTHAVALQGTALSGVGFGAAGTVADKDERDYHYGVIPRSLLELRLIVADRVMLEAAGRYYYVTGAGAGGGASARREGQEHIARVNVGYTMRVYGPHALGIQYLLSSRDTSSSGVDRHQSVQTVSLTYNFLRHAHFGAVEWLADAAASR